MDERRKVALEKHHHKLRTGLLIGNILPALHSMLTPVEYSCIRDRESKVAMVDELIDILLTKENGDFEEFCNTLEQNGYPHWARKLREDVHQADGKLCEASLSYLATRTRRCRRTEEKYFMVTSLLLRARNRGFVRQSVAMQTGDSQLASGDLDRFATLSCTSTMFQI